MFRCFFSIHSNAASESVRINRNAFKPPVSDYVKDIVRRNFSREMEFYEFCKDRLYKQYRALKLPTTQSKSNGAASSTPDVPPPPPPPSYWNECDRIKANRNRNRTTKSEIENDTCDDDNNNNNHYGYGLEEKKIKSILNIVSDSFALVYGQHNSFNTYLISSLFHLFILSSRFSFKHKHTCTHTYTPSIYLSISLCGVCCACVCLSCLYLSSVCFLLSSSGEMTQYEIYSTRRKHTHVLALFESLYSDWPF